MQLGAALAGLAIENSMLGAAHGLANPLTATYGIVHGQAVGLMLPHVIRFNAPQVDDVYQWLLESTEPSDQVTRLDSGAESLADYVTHLATQAGLATRLSQCGVKEDALPTLATDAARQWTTSFNPRPADKDALLQLYRLAF